MTDTRTYTVERLISRLDQTHKTEYNYDPDKDEAVETLRALLEERDRLTKDYEDLSQEMWLSGD